MDAKIIWNIFETIGYSIALLFMWYFNIQYYLNWLENTRLNGIKWLYIIEFCGLIWVNIVLHKSLGEQYIINTFALVGIIIFGISALLVLPNIRTITKKNKDSLIKYYKEIIMSIVFAAVLIWLMTDLIQYIDF